MGQAEIEELLSDVLGAFPVPAFFIGSDKPGDAFQALDHLTGSGQISLELGNPALEPLCIPVNTLAEKLSRICCTSTAVAKTVSTRDNKTQ